MRRRLRLWLMRWREESLICSVGHHQAMKDLHEDCYERDCDALRKLRAEIALATPADKMLGEIVRNRGRA